MKERISTRVKKLGFPVGEYVVVGGAMEAYGIRDAKDLDIVVTESLFEKLLSEGRQLCICEECRVDQEKGSSKRMLKKPGVDIISQYTWKDTYQADTTELIRNANIIDDVPFVQLEELLKWKKAAAREKDLKDVELIEYYLNKRK